MITPKLASSLYTHHNRYWDRQRAEMRRLRNVYLMRYWQRQKWNENLLIETSRGYELIESYVASLFVRDPAVVVKPDLRGRGDPELTQEVADTWLLTARRQIEDGLRISLIYPWSAFKLVPNESPDVLKRIDLVPIGPWDILVDDTASTWETQRYIGHRYYMPLETAKKKFGNRTYSKRSFQRYVDYQDADSDVAAYRTDNDPISQAIEDYILVIEFYDLVDDKLVVWSPDYADGDRFLYDGVELEVGVDAENLEKVKFTSIPYRTQSDTPIVPIVPLFMSREPDEPMRGYSALRRVYDQIVETNTMRTFQANGIRKAARQWMVAKGLLDPESQAKMAQGQDGEFIEVEVSVGQDLRSMVVPVPHTPVPPELETYRRQVDDDFSRGAVMAPFTRGQATKATATEITALAAYSASEVGRMARERDAMIAQIARTYTVMLATLMNDGAETVRLGGKPVILQPADLQGDFAFFAQDSGSTPLSDAVKKQELLQLIPTLTSLGVPSEVILKNLVRSYGLSEEFLPEPKPPSPAGGAGLTANVASAATPGPNAIGPEDLVGEGSLGLTPGSLPSPGKISAVLPPGGVV